MTCDDLDQTTHHLKTQFDRALIDSKQVSLMQLLHGADIISITLHYIVFLKVEDESL